MQQFMIEYRGIALELAIKTSVLLEKAWEAERMGGDIDLKDVRITGMERVEHFFRRRTKEDEELLLGLMRSARTAHRIAGGVV